MRAFMRRENVLQAYQQFSKEDTQVPMLYDYGCGEDVDGNLFEYHDSAEIEVQTDEVRPGRNHSPN